MLRLPGLGRTWYLPRPTVSVGDSLAVELPALDRAALVRIQVPQPANSTIGYANSSDRDLESGSAAVSLRLAIRSGTLSAGHARLNR